MQTKDYNNNNTVKKKKINEVKENVDDIFRDSGLDKIVGIKAKTRREIKRMVIRRIKVFSVHKKFNVPNRTEQEE